MTITNAERVEGAIVRLRDAVLNGWAIDTEDGMLCQYCGAEVEPEHGDDNSENVLKGECKYECEHGDDCVVRIAPDVVPVLGEAATTDKATSAMELLEMALSDMVEQRDRYWQQRRGDVAHGLNIAIGIMRCRAKNEAVSA